MAGTQVVQFFALISLMIFSTHADTKMIFTDGIGGFKYDSEVPPMCEDHYYYGSPRLQKVIIYIKTYSEMKTTTLDDNYHSKRKAIADVLYRDYRVLLYLGADVTNPNITIGNFLRLSINHYSPFQKRDHEIVTIGEGNLDLTYVTMVGNNLTKYQEGSIKIYGVDLQEKLRSISA